MEEMGGGDQRSENGTSENEILEVAPLLLAGSTRTRVEEIRVLELEPENTENESALSYFSQGSHITGTIRDAKDRG